MPTMRPKTTEELRSELKVNANFAQKAVLAKATPDEIIAQAKAANIPLERDRTSSPARREYTTSNGSKVHLTENDVDIIRATKATGRFTANWSKDKMNNDDLISKIPSGEINSIIPENTKSSNERKMTPAEQEQYESERAHSGAHTFNEPTLEHFRVLQAIKGIGRKKEFSDYAEKKNLGTSAEPKTAKDRINELEEKISAGAKAAPRAPLRSKSDGRASATPGRARTSFEEDAEHRPSAPKNTSSSSASAAIQSQSELDKALEKYAREDRAASAPRVHYPNNTLIPTEEEENPYPTSFDIKTMEEEGRKVKEPVDLVNIEDKLKQEKVLAKAAFEEMFRPYVPNTDNPVAGLRPNQKRYRQFVEQGSPHSLVAQSERARNRELLYAHLKDRTGSQIAKPYLDRLSQNPAQMHEELMGDTERKHLDSIRDESQQMFNEDILPGIRAKYQVPGLLQHGHMGRDIGRAAEKFGKGVSHTIAQTKGEFRNMTLAAAQKYAGQQGQAAEIHSHAAEKDNVNSQAAFNALHSMRQQENAEKNQYGAKLNAIGTEDWTREQDRINAADKRHNEARDYRRHNIGYASDIINKYQQIQPIAQPARVPSTAGGVSQALASVLASGATNMMGWNQQPQQQQQPQQRKKGGRVKKAYGGIVNPAETAIQNAVVQKSDPIYELRRLLNMPDPVQQYAEGGQVNPIQAGAQEAQQYAGHAAMQKRLARLRQPVENPGMMGHLMEGMGAMGDNKSWLANVFRAGHAGYSSAKAQKQAGRANLDAADELEYKLQNDIDKQNMERRKLAIQEQVAKAKMGKYSLEMAKLRGELGGGHRPTPKRLSTGKTQSKEDKEAIKKSYDVITAANVAKKAASEANKALHNAGDTGALSGLIQDYVPGGSYLTAAGEGVGNLLTKGKWGDVTPEKRELAKTHQKGAFESELALSKIINKHKTTKAEIDIIEESKQSTRNTPIGNDDLFTKGLGTKEELVINEIKNLIRHNATEDEITERLNHYGLTPEDLFSSPSSSTPAPKAKDVSTPEEDNVFRTPEEEVELAELRRRVKG